MQFAACCIEGSSNVSNIDPEIELTFEVNGRKLLPALQLQIMKIVFFWENDWKSPTLWNKNKDPILPS